ncbi:MAG: hypothetical protein JWO07_93 [Candidatus Saccharibacteria bacterium]|nr:hypothetical protein [Candidatus Saccharibacteria bacterium]
MFRGRIDQVGYYLGWVYIYGPLFGLFILADPYINSDSASLLYQLHIPLFYAALAYLAFSFFAFAGLTTRRMHDFNEPGGWALANKYFVATPGDKGRNEYGDPRRPRGYTGVMFGTGQKPTKNRSK